MRKARAPRVVACLALLLYAAAPGHARAQTRTDGSALRRVRVVNPRLTTVNPADDTVASWWAPLASLAIPGTGQSMLRQPRSVAYVAAEAFLVIQYLAAQRDGNRERLAYRQLAAEVARKPFNGTQIGSWDYYESMEKYLESGAFDMTPGGPVNPETDESTYNGARWLLARETYWSNPNVAPATASAEYQRALAFYLAYAVPPEFRWSWRDQQLQQDLYHQSIRTANRSFQRATNVAGFIAVNHLASLVDAYVSVRLRKYGTPKVAGLQLDGVTTTYETGRFGAGEWRLGVRAR